MFLKEYKSKRNFIKTSEPKGSIKNKNRSIFVVHKHNAQNLHWDLRLAMNGVLKSWAIPKKPPMKSNLKRLAIMVEDHPLEYAKFHGTIPKGEYGAGKVEIWDKGKYQIEEGTLEKGHLQIGFSGDKLKEKYHLIRTNFKGTQNSWLFFKAKAKS